MPINAFHVIALALDPGFILRARGIQPDAWQQRLLLCEDRQILLNCSRQSGKSTTVAALALHTALCRSRSLVLLLSPSLRQSIELFRKVLDCFNGIREMIAVNTLNQTSVEFANRSRIICLPGEEETIRSFSGVNLLVIDEAARVPEDLYRSVRPMLAVSRGRLICLSTPFGKQGWFYREWHNGEEIADENPLRQQGTLACASGLRLQNADLKSEISNLQSAIGPRGDWMRIRIPWQECPRIRADFIELEKRSMGESWIRQEYECSFEALEGLVYPDFEQQSAFVIEDSSGIERGGTRIEQMGADSESDRRQSAKSAFIRVPSSQGAEEEIERGGTPENRTRSNADLADPRGSETNPKRKQGTLAGASSSAFLRVRSSIRVPSSQVPVGRRVGGIDFGFRNPFCALWGVLDRDDVLWITDERYVREAPIHEHAAALKEAEVGQAFQPDSQAGKPDLPRSSITWYADPAGRTEIEELRHGGLKVIRGNNDIQAGIAAINARLRTGRLKVLRAMPTPPRGGGMEGGGGSGGVGMPPSGCPNLLAEAKLYRYPDLSPVPSPGRGGGRGEVSEIPIDQHNHALAALRYLVSRLDAGFMAKFRNQAAPRPQAQLGNEGGVDTGNRPRLQLDNEQSWKTVIHE